MMEQLAQIIKDNPIGTGLDSFRALFHSVCRDKAIPCTPDALGQLNPEDLDKLVLSFLSAAQSFPAARLLPARAGRGTIRSDLLRLELSLDSDDFDLDRVEPLLKTALADDLDDACLWNKIYEYVAEPTLPPRSVPSSLQQPSLQHSTNSSEYRQDAKNILKLGLGPLYVGLRCFYKTYFGGVAGLEAASEAVYKKCVEGSDPLFGNRGWNEWPVDIKVNGMLAWFSNLIPKIEAFAKDYSFTSAPRRRLFAPLKTSLLCSIGEHSIYTGFVDDELTHTLKAGVDSKYRYSGVLVPGELNSSQSSDKASIAWTDLAAYAREVLSIHPTRRFVLGFTLCGPLMRVWEFDRLGGIASENFDINKDGLKFVTAVLGFLWMDEEQLGFDPTFKTANGQHFIEIQRDGVKERLIIDEVIKRPRSLAGRATTCWKAHREGDTQTFVIKDSWQYLEREEEGELLREATEKGVVKVARYYHHETVQVGNMDDDIQRNIRKGLDVTKATNCGKKQPALVPSESKSAVLNLHIVHNSLLNRIHRRVILRDYGIPIYKASSRTVLLTALKDCIKGHKSLLKAGVLHRDISISNLLINEGAGPSWSSFLIDLDLAIRVQPGDVSCEAEMAGTRAFMAIGALLGEQHTFMHDLESFFWVLFWICIHYNGPGESKVVPRFEKWNYVDTEELVGMKLGVVAEEEIFMRTISNNFTPFYEPLTGLLNELRKVVFPKDKSWEREDVKLYSQMRQILQGWKDSPDATTTC